MFDAHLVHFGRTWALKKPRNKGEEGKKKRISGMAVGSDLPTLMSSIPKTEGKVKG